MQCELLTKYSVNCTHIPINGWQYKLNLLTKYEEQFGSMLGVLDTNQTEELLLKYCKNQIPI